MGIRTAELFAGVGGFRLGLEATNHPFQTVWFNQWEPGSKSQHAWNRYVLKFCTERGEPVPEFSNRDIGEVAEQGVPEHDLLVGGFPCQDYSVATTLDKAGGLQGKKGVLWWEIERLLRHHTPRYLLLENVDRLLKSPAKQRGRDFAILLYGLNQLGYAVEWRVINAADYGNAQRRRRTFIFAAHKSTGIANHMATSAKDSDYLHRTGFFASRFPVSSNLSTEAEWVQLGEDLQLISDEFEHRFQNAGVMLDGEFATQRVEPTGPGGTPLLHKLENGDVAEAYFLDMDRIEAWKTVKGPKRDKRTSKKNGYEYYYTEGGMQFPDLHETPARTVLTSEGNRTPNRSTHVVKDPKTGRLRFLLPIEVERIMGFPEKWTEGLPERWRYFTMGNALVVPVVTDIGHQLAEWVKTHEDQDVRKRLLDGKSKKRVVEAAPRQLRRKPGRARGGKRTQGRR